MLVPGCDLPSILAASERIATGADPRATLAELLPGLVEQIVADAAHASFCAWGESTVVDENTGEAVISPSLFDELHRLAGLPATWPVGNAGLLHVYGYLLSSARTPFGNKRDRWTDGGVARSFDRHPEEFAPWSPDPGTTLERVADAATRATSSPAVVLVVEESSEMIAARTTVVRGRAGHCALVYTVNGKLLTVFPLASPTTAWIDGLLSSAPRLRYNAVVGTDRVELSDRRVLRAP